MRNAHTIILRSGSYIPRTHREARHTGCSVTSRHAHPYTCCRPSTFLLPSPPCCLTFPCLRLHHSVFILELRDAPKTPDIFAAIPNTTFKMIVEASAATFQSQVSNWICGVWIWPPEMICIFFDLDLLSALELNEGVLCRVDWHGL